MKRVIHCAYACDEITCRIFQWIKCCAGIYGSAM